MDVVGLRRSTRVRKQVKSYAASECGQQSAQAFELIHTSSVKPHSHGLKGSQQTHDDQSDSLSVDHGNSIREISEQSKLNTNVSFEQPRGHTADESLISLGDGRMRKEPRNHTIPDNTKFSVKKNIAQANDNDLKRSAKRSQRDAKIDPESEQLYGNPAEGTMIPWGEGRMRKQPKIYPIAQRISYPSKMAEGDRWMASAAANKIARQKSSIRKLRPGEVESRLRTYVGNPPSWYSSFLEKANSERMIVLERTRGIEEGCHAHHEDCPFETLQVAGSKGNVYSVTISHLTSCTCPVGIYSGKGNDKQCKHVLYTLHHVLKVPDRLKYQPAFLTSELKEIFAHASPLPTDAVEAESKDGNRKAVEGDCPICFMEFDDDEKVVWCKAACGNNIHKHCFDQWAKSRAPVTCPFCRSKWEFEKTMAQKTMIADVRMPTEVGPGGYFNVYDQLDYADHGHN